MAQPMTSIDNEVSRVESNPMTQLTQDGQNQPNDAETHNTTAFNTNTNTDTDTDTHKDTDTEAHNTTEAGTAPDNTANIPQATRRTLLRIIKGMALVFIALCVGVGSVVSKVSLVSITSHSRTINYTQSSDGRASPESVLFIQLTLLLVIPEVVSFIRCLVWGVIGKTSESYPWPRKLAFLKGLVTSCFEVCAICGFIYGAACKLPPSLTILLMNGCFLFPIGWYICECLKIPTIVLHIFSCWQQKSEYMEMNDRKSNGSKTYRSKTHGSKTHGSKLQCLLCLICLLTSLMQFGALVSIPILLSNEHYFVPFEETEHYIIATYILIPVSLFIISIVWSGWIQKAIITSSVNNTDTTSDAAAKDETANKKVETTRYKSGLISSAFRIILIPLVSYGYALLLLDHKINLHASSFHWNDFELSTFLTHVIVSYLTYLFAWYACALQSLVFIFPLILSTPIAFAWYIGSIEVNEVFPFTDEYFDEWNLNYVVIIVASLLWISQVLTFGYLLFQKSDKVLNKDSELFWMPRYNSIFLEQQLLLNKKTAISGDTEESQEASTEANNTPSSDNLLYICSTMYHESEEEMKQLLKSIGQVASSGIQNTRKRKFESHIFFDNACNGKQLNQWALQLLGLLKDTLGITDSEINKSKMPTAYGMQLEYTLKRNIRLYIHLKDNSKVKNKKRWSQVMYMEFVKHRIKECDIDIDKAFILTTDADIKFTSDSVAALLDILVCDKKAGAVCARTHPLGSGPVVWYQKFDYAIGHWFQKAAEHILGCVLCCPGCFSVFRVSALNSVLDTSISKTVLDTYSSNVEGGFDFLTKDMGEDRWLCTLLIEAGWRLKYSAVSQNYTYCPESFEEFYKQRRRWIPSTIANLALLIDRWNKITSKNSSITIVFILYEFLIIFSSLISPATVILIIVTGIKGLDHSVNELALIIVLSVISVLYGVICIYATEKTQLGIAKALTLVFSIIMAVVISGILSETIGNVIKGDRTKHTNQTSHNFHFPTDISAVYSGLFATTFTIAGILHFNEILCLLHVIWYILCLPSGYLFLMIYSVCNLNNRSWGTREETKPKSRNNSESWVDYFLEKISYFRKYLSKCIEKLRHSQAANLDPTEDPESSHPGNNNPLDSNQDQLIKHIGKNNPSMLDKDVKVWLHNHRCYGLYAKNFEREGYTKEEFIANMEIEDFEAIGVNKRGFQLKLAKEAKKLCNKKIKISSENVSAWLKSLKLEEYEQLFELEGYFSDEDVENLKELTEENLRDMGITKRAHLNQLMKGLRGLGNATDSGSTSDPKTKHAGNNNPSLLNEKVEDWLKEHECYELYAENFEREGYTKKEFIATMEIEDFEAIGIKKRGFQLKLIREARKLQGTTFEVKVPENVPEWLKSLDLEEYTELFKLEGYFTGEDVENLKGLTKEKLQDMGITKRAHLNQLMTGLRYLKCPSDTETRIDETRALMKSTKLKGKEGQAKKEDKKEFWDKLIEKTLKPDSNLSKVEGLREKLRNLRNLSVLILFLINIMWIVFLYTLVFPQLTKHNLPDKAFSLLFLIIFSIIVIIQFVAMIIHRFKTLLHLLAGIKLRNSHGTKAEKAEV